MRTGFAIGIGLLAFVAGALATTALAHGGGMSGMMGGMADWTPAQMFEFCQSMMGGAGGT